MMVIEPTTCSTLAVIAAVVPLAFGGERETVGAAK